MLTVKEFFEQDSVEKFERTVGKNWQKITWKENGLTKKAVGEL